MLQSMGSQEVGHDLAAEQQQQWHLPQTASETSLQINIFFKNIIFSYKTVIST